MEPRMRRIAAPREGEGYWARAFLDVGLADGLAHGRGDGGRVDLLAEREVASEHRQIVQRQVVGLADADRVAARLHRELRRPDDGRADALAGVPDRRQVTPARQRMGKLVREV